MSTLDAMRADSHDADKFTKTSDIRLRVTLVVNKYRNDPGRHRDELTSGSVNVSQQNLS